MRVKCHGALLLAAMLLLAGHSGDHEGIVRGLAESARPMVGWLPALSPLAGGPRGPEAQTTQDTPWEGPDCVVAEGVQPFTVLCRDADRGLDYAADNGEAFPETPTAPDGYDDPAEVHSGLDIYALTRKRFAPFTKLAPVLFDTTPPFSAAQLVYFQENEKAWTEAQAYWTDVRHQLEAFRRLHRRAHDDRRHFRHIVLRDGYLFTEDPGLARYIFKEVGLGDLFAEDMIYLQRGDTLMGLRRSRGRYVHADGPFENQTAGVFPLDRLATTRDELVEPRHWDLQAVRLGLGLRTLTLEQGADITPFRSTFVSGQSVEGFLYRRENRTAVVVTGTPPQHWKRRYTDSRRLVDLRLKILGAAEDFVRERIRFDEPVVEIGQQDGILRHAWQRAYRQRETQYEVNGVLYNVFSSRGVPLPPQVCIDFVMDSIERASGRWWRPRGHGPGLKKGGVRWRDHEGLRPRRIQSVLEFAARASDILEAYAVPEDETVQYHETDRFYENLESFPVDFREADIVIIWGYKNDGKLHYHSFFVHRVDPIDGFPIALSDNAGIAAIRTWHDIMRRAPRRFVHYHLRLRDDWLLANLTPVEHPGDSMFGALEPGDDGKPAPSGGTECRVVSETSDRPNDGLRGPERTTADF